MARVFVGIPCYDMVAHETLEDYMRLAYNLGRRHPEHEFVLGIKAKSEQFRARNAIVTGALQTSCDYLFFLDDDHIIGWAETSGPDDQYNIVGKLIRHMEENPEAGVIGALYFHRGAECRPVIMKEGKDGGTYWMRDDEVLGQLQEVAVQGGGCMLLRMKMFDKWPGPWFEPEITFGTDLQICQKAKEHGWKVFCDTSITVGHVMAKREIVTPQNRHRIAAENANQRGGGDDGIDKNYKVDSALRLYRMDAEEYLGMGYLEMGTIACRYGAEEIKKALAEGKNLVESLKDYYSTRGNEQLARQVLYHHLDGSKEQMRLFFDMIDANKPVYGCDFGCGSAPISFEWLMKNHKVDFIDVDGAGAYEFTKWRVRKRGLQHKAGFKLAGPYDYVAMFDSLEHIPNWKEVLGDLCDRLKPGGCFVTNYFINNDHENPEHISMDKTAVNEFLKKKGLFALNPFLYAKANLGHMDVQEIAA